MALSANRELNRYVDQELRTLPVKASAHIYKGGFVGLNGGYARPLVAGDAFAGIAYEEIDNSSGSDGDLMCRVFTQSDVEHALTGASRSYNGRALYASDDGTLTTTATGKSFVGYQLDVPGTNKVVLRIQTTAMSAGGVRQKVVSKASATNVTIGLADFGGVILVTGTTASNLNLPAAATAGAGSWCTFVKTGATGALTIEPNESETIDGAANNADMDAQYDTITIVCDGTGWLIVDKKIAA